MNGHVKFKLSYSPSHLGRTQGWAKRGCTPLHSLSDTCMGTPHDCLITTQSTTPRKMAQSVESTITGIGEFKITMRALPND